MTGEEVLIAFKYINWDQIYESTDGSEFGLVLDGEITKVTKVHSVSKRDSDYDREVSVIIKVDDEYFKREGYMNVGSSCYDDYDSISWERGLTKVEPKTKTVTYWE